MRAPDLRRPSLRLAVLRAVLCAGMIAVAVRAGQLGLFEERTDGKDIRQRIKSVTLAAERGEIVDRQGQQLAVTVKAPSVFAVPTVIVDRPGVAKALATALGADPARIEKRLSYGRHFTYVERHVSAEQAERVRALGIEGVGIADEPRRVYPHGGFAAQVVGFSNIDGFGARGIEQQEDALLRGVAQKVPVERDARGELLLSESIDPSAAVGGDVQLTIDAAFQSDAEAALDEAMAATRSASGIVVSLDPRTGDVLSLAERPTFDPNRYRTTSFLETRARSLLDAYEPGSTFKVFLMAAALEAGAVAPGDQFDCENGRYRVPGKLIRDAHPYGVLDLHHVLWKSSNIGVTKIAYKLGPDTHHRMLEALGFGKPTGSGFPHESNGLLRGWRRWRPVDRANIAFGQGINVTALQMAVATAAVANGGVLVEPRLVLARKPRGASFVAAPPGRSRQAMSPAIAATLLEMMEGVTGPEGTGKRAALPGIRVAGKTGTAQKLDPKTGAYSNSRYQAWFIGAAPANDPRLVVVVMLDEPKGLAHTGGAVAAPVFAKVAGAQLARLGIFPSPATPPQVVPPAATQVAATAPDAAASLDRFGDRVLVPDFTDQTVEEVRRFAVGVLDVVVSGHGRAVAQEPPPGTILNGHEARVLVRFEGGPGEG